MIRTIQKIAVFTFEFIQISRLPAQPESGKALFPDRGIEPAFRPAARQSLVLPYFSYRNE